MPRLPYAAETLRDQVLSLKPRTKVEPHGDPDGFRVYRSIIFNKATSTWLQPLLETIADPRIVGLETVSDGRLVVVFHAGPPADDRSPFPLEKVAQILGEK